MNLSFQQLEEVPDEGIIKPPTHVQDWPDRVIQFGTGVLLRALPDYIIDQANQRGQFLGRIVVVKSTDSGDPGAFDRQNNLYTVCVRGIEHGHKLTENRICSAISRVLSAASQWSDVLALASKDTIRIVISNTTEVGIKPVQERIDADPPASYPGKLLAFLYARFKACAGATEGGLVIIPTELISDNGQLLKSIVTDLAHFNDLEPGFLDWLDHSNHFCSSLVDRIVPGKPNPAMLNQIQTYLGYEDELLLICEAYHLWAIEGDKAVLSPILSFAEGDPGMVIAPSITVFKELKLRLLNGTHTLCCGLAFLSGFDTVRDAMEDDYFSEFVQTLMLDEIAGAIPLTLPEGAAHDFGLKVLDRFRNPFLEHRWLSITTQYSAKLTLRVIPLLLKYVASNDTLPGGMVKGFAGHIVFMKPVRCDNGKYWGESRGIRYAIVDDAAAFYDECWKKHPDEKGLGAVVHDILEHAPLWGIDLTTLTGLEAAVLEQVNLLLEKGGL
jgi:tagaturonate reductase